MYNSYYGSKDILHPYSLILYFCQSQTYLVIGLVCS